MGFMSSVRRLTGGHVGKMLMATKLIPEITRLVRSRNEHEIAEALRSDGDMKRFAETIYPELSPAIRAKVPLDGFKQMVVRYRQRMAG